MFVDSHIPPDARGVTRLTPAEDFYFIYDETRGTYIVPHKCISGSYLQSDNALRDTFTLVHLDWNKVCLTVPIQLGSACNALASYTAVPNGEDLYERLYDGYPLADSSGTATGPRGVYRSARGTINQHLDEDHCFDLPWPPLYVYRGSDCHHDHERDEICLSTSRHVFSSVSSATFGIVNSILHAVESAVLKIASLLLPILHDVINTLLKPLVTYSQQHPATLALTLCAIFLTAHICTYSPWPAAALAIAPLVLGTYTYTGYLLVYATCALLYTNFSRPSH